MHKMRSKRNHKDFPKVARSGNIILFEYCFQLTPWRLGPIARTEMKKRGDQANTKGCTVAASFVVVAAVVGGGDVFNQNYHPLSSSQRSVYVTQDTDHNSPRSIYASHGHIADKTHWWLSTGLLRLTVVSICWYNSNKENRQTKISSINSATAGLMDANNFRRRISNQHKRLSR